MRFRCLNVVCFLATLPIALATPRSSAAEATFFRGLNLNGPAVVIDGQTWQGADSKHYECLDRAFENQNVPLIPPTDAERARMIRSSRWGGSQNKVVLKDLPTGAYSIFLYVWEDNDPETFSIFLDGKEVQPRYNSGTAGHWEKLGPWFVNVTSGQVTLTSKGGAANFSGIEIWRGKHDGSVKPVDPEALKFFEQRVRPVLAEHCYECHSARSKNVGGQLLLDTRQGWLAGGESGPAIVPGDAAASFLVKAIRRQDDAPHMPPSKRLPDAAIADLTRWIELGAPDPRDGAELTAAKHEALLKEGRERWAFMPPTDPDLPDVKPTDWPRTGVDHFILQRLEAAGLKPVDDAEPRALFRRARYDLTGLPPSPEELAAFLADDAPDALERTLDRWLAAPTYAERWGRHWLDVVRYSDTAGDNSDFPIPQMVLYRDWVTGALNRDLPYDQFVREQLAGDLLPAADDEERHQRIVATGYIANARRFGSRVDDYPQHLTIEDTIDNVGRAFLGLTINCARCHDHKFDPISTEDYYGLYGIFHSTRYPWPGIELEQKQRDLVALVDAQQAAAAEEAHRARKKELEAEVKRLEEEREAAGEDQKKELTKAVDAAKKAAEAHSKTLPPIPWAYAVAEASHSEDVRVQMKGDPAKLGPLVPRRFPSVLGGQKLADQNSSSGRLSLAEWIVDRNNPLTARVMANRVWTWHFGRGLVPTPNDFGKQGKAVTHPELVDWLAHRFIESSWSIKKLHRLMMGSHVYRTAAIQDAPTVPGDPANDLLSGFRPRRLDAESIRDTLLLLSGELDSTPGGPHPFPPSREWKFTQHNPFKAVYETNRRSVYLMTQRIQRHPYLAIFDGPDPAASTPQRLTSTTPLQALFLLNDPFVHKAAEGFAARLRAECPDESERIGRAYHLLFSRPPVTEEIERAKSFLSAAKEVLANSGNDQKKAEDLAWQSYVRSLLLLNEFVYVD